MRKYCIGAFLLDRDEPTRVIGRLREPLIKANESEREAISRDAIGKPGPSYVQFTVVEARKAMSGMGMSGSAVEAMLEMQRAFNDGNIRPAWEGDAESTTSTTMEKFADATIVVAYGAAA